MNKPMTEPATGDPWIDAYLAFRAALLDGRFSDLAEVKAYALEAKRHLPSPSPSMPAAIFITRDIARTFPAWSSPELMTALWVPSDGRPPDSQ